MYSNDCAYLLVSLISYTTSGVLTFNWVLQWRIDNCTHFLSKFCGDGGLAHLDHHEFSVNFPELVDNQGDAFSLEKVDNVFVRIGGFLPDKLSGEEVGMGQSSGCSSLYNLILSIVVGGSICVVWDINCAFHLVDQGVCFLQPGNTKDDVFISTVDNVKKNLMNNSFDLNKHGGNELDSSIVVGTINILGTDRFRKVIV